MAKNKEFKLCQCGCGFLTQSMFAPGHDAKHKSILLQRMKAGDESAMDEMLSRGWMKGESTRTYQIHTPKIDLPPAPVETEDDKIMDRVAKILALKSNAGTAEEAEAAAAMAQKLAYRYNLDLEAIEQGRQETGKGKRPIIRGMIDLESKAAWLQDLFSTVCQYNFCRVVMYAGTARLAIIGERHNILVVDYVYQFLVREINRLADAGWEVAKSSSWSGVQEWKKSFRFGAISGVAAALHRQREVDVKETNSMALVIRKTDAVDEEVRRLFPRLGNARTRNIRLGDGYNEGFAAGNSIQIRRGVDSGKRPSGALPAGR